MITTTDIFTITNQKQFEKIALKIFRFQYENNLVYREFCDFLNTDVQKVKSLEKIPFNTKLILLNSSVPIPINIGLSFNSTIAKIELT